MKKIIYQLISVSIIEDYKIPSLDFVENFDTLEEAQEKMKIEHDMAVEDFTDCFSDESSNEAKDYLFQDSIGDMDAVVFRDEWNGTAWYIRANKIEN